MVVWVVVQSPMILPVVEFTWAVAVVRVTPTMVRWVVPVVRAAVLFI